MGKTKTTPSLGKGSVGSRCFAQDENRRFPLPEMKQGDSQIAEHRRPAWSERLALLEANPGRLEPALFEMLDTLEEQPPRLRDLLLGRVCVDSPDHDDFLLSR